MAAVASGGGGRLRVLCLHSFRASAAILQKQMSIARWDAAVDDLVDLVYIDAPMPASGPSDLEKHFDPPYFEWWSASQDGKVYVGADTSITYVRDNLTLHGPFDGLLGFSQGGMLASYLLALLQEGEVDMTTPPRFCILIGAGLPRADALAAAFRRPITVPSLHLIGEQETRTFSRHDVSCFKTATKIQSSFSIHVAMWFRAQMMMVLLAYVNFSLDNYPSGVTCRPPATWSRGRSAIPNANYIFLPHMRTSKFAGNHLLAFSIQRSTI
eukprot:SM000001S04735  [mRNA]  locus=s1:1967901:1969925:+ [translate_table: standard]